MSSSPVPLKIRREGERCTLNLSRAQASSRWWLFFRYENRVGGTVVRHVRAPAAWGSHIIDTAHTAVAAPLTRIYVTVWCQKRDFMPITRAMDEQLKALLEGINALKSGQEDMQRSQEEMKKIVVVEEKIEKKVEQVEERIGEIVDERIEGVGGNFSLISQRMEDLEKKLLAGGNEYKSKSLHVSAFLEPVLASPVPVPASPVSVKLSTYDGKTNWEVYKIQFSIISEANGWTEGVEACQLAAYLRGEATDILQTLPDTERLNLNSLYNALDLRFGQKYSKKYARLQMKTRLRKTGESLQEFASEVKRLANLAFSDHPATVREVISLQYFGDSLKEKEIQKAVRMADVVKSATYMP
ncbi:uncharacterized protein TNCV_137001 [Trichonephila clavipes]|nr:uncharacterized protein TNCV_137001 [Trichonephila clavipes]